MAAKDINEAGGVNGRKIVLTIEDDAGLRQFKADRRSFREESADHHAALRPGRQSGQNGRRLDGEQIQGQDNRFCA